MADDNLQLPPGYEDAKPVQQKLQLPPGYEDAKPVENDASHVYAGPKAGTVTPPPAASSDYEVRPVLPSGERVGAIHAKEEEQPGTVGEQQAVESREKEHPILSAYGHAVENANDKARKMSETGAEYGKTVAQAPVVGYTAITNLPEELTYTMTPKMGPAPNLESPEDIAKREHPVAMGVTGGVGSMAGGVVADPRQWPLLFLGGEAVGPIIQKAISAAFAANMAHETIEGAKQLGANWDNMTPEERAEQITNLGLSDIFAGMAGAHAVGEAGVRGAYNIARDRVNPVPESAMVKSLHAETAKYEKLYDAAKEKLDTYQHSQAQGVNPPEEILKAYDKAAKKFAEAKFHEEVALEAESKAAAGRRASNATVPESPRKEPGKVTDNVQNEIPAEQIEAKPTLTNLGKKTTTPITVPVEYATTTIPQEPTQTPRPSYGQITLAGNQGTMGKPLMLTEGTPEVPKVEGELPKTEAPKETVTAPKVATAADLKSLKAKEGKVIDTDETAEGKVYKLLQDALNPNFRPAAAEAPKVEAPMYEGEERRSTPRSNLMSPTEIEEAIKNRKPVHTPFDDTEGAMETIKRDQMLPKHPAEEAAAKNPKKVFYRGTNAEEARKIEETGKISPDAFSSGHITPDRETAEAYAKHNGGKVYTVNEGDIPEKDLAHYRETGRGPIVLSAEVPTAEHTGRPNIPKEEGGYTPKKEEVLPVGAEGREPAKSGAEYTPAIQQKVNELSDENLKKLAQAHGLNPDEYDLNARDARRHRVERDQLAKEITEQMGEDEKINLGRAAEATERQGTFEGADVSAKGRAERAAKMFPRLRGPVDEYGNPKVGGGAPDEEAERLKEHVASTSSKDTDHVQAAMKELGPNAKLSDIMQRAQELKEASKQIASAKADYDAEHTFAKDFLADKNHIQDYPHYNSYVKTIADEAKVLKEGGSTLFVGSGPMPLSSMLLSDHGFPVDSLEIDPKTAELGEKVAEKHGSKTGNFIAGDARTFKKYNDYDNVVVALEAGPDAKSKYDVLNNVVNGAKPGATILTRGSADDSFVNVEKNLPESVHIVAEIPTFDGHSKTYVLEKDNTVAENKAVDNIKSGKSNYAILTAENPNNTRLSPEENLKRNAALLKEVKDMGYNPVPVDGYNSDVEGKQENSFYVDGMKPEEAANLGKKYDQSSVITKQGLHDLSKNTVNPQIRENLKTGDVAKKSDYYSKIGKDYISFDFDFGKEESPKDEFGNPTVSGGAPETKKLPTGDELIKKYGESNGDPAHTTFILPDGRGVANTGVEHDRMLGGTPLDKVPPRERFVDQGNIRVRPRAGGKGGREVALSIPESGINTKQLDYIKKMGPQLRSGAVLIEVGKPGGDYKVIPYGEASDEKLESTLRGLAPIKNDKGSPVDEFGNPTVSGGSPAEESKTVEKALDKIKSESNVLRPGKVTVEDLNAADKRHFLLADGSMISEKVPIHADIEAKVGKKNLTTAKAIRMAGPAEFDVKSEPTPQQMRELGRIIGEYRKDYQYGKIYWSVDTPEYTEGKLIHRSMEVGGAGTFADFQRDVDKTFAPVRGTTPTAEGLKAKLPELAQKHLTEEEKAGITTTATGKPRTAGTEKFISNMEKVPEVQEYVDIALQGEGARKWYSRSSAAFDAMVKEAPDYFKKGDKEKFLGVLAGSSPQQPVAMNLREALGFWKEWNDAGRPSFSLDKWKEFVDKADEAWKEDGSPRARGLAKGASTYWDYAPTGEKWKAENLLLKNLTLPETKVPNIIKALNGEDMWPDLTKNQLFKVPSFTENLKKWSEGKSTGTKHVTNDSWMGLFGGIDKSAISKPENYHPLSVVTRAAAEELGWEPEEAQAAIWSFTKALTEKGVTDPELIRHYSEDFRDLMENDPQTRDLLSDLGVNLDDLDKRLKDIGEKPKVSGRSTPTTAHSVRQLKTRIEEARGKGSIPEPKSVQGILFRENPSFEHRENPGEGRYRNTEDAATRFNPKDFENEESGLKSLGEKKKKSPYGSIK